MSDQSEFRALLRDRFRSEFPASQQYTAVAVYLDAQDLPGSPRTSTRSRSRSATMR